MNKSLIQQTKGRFFRVVFTKKNGERRVMIARTGVAKHLRGGGLSYDPAQHNLVTAFDVQKKEYRSIPLDRVLSFSSGKLNWSAQ